MPSNVATSRSFVHSRLCGCVLTASVTLTAAEASAWSAWSMGGHDLANSRSNWFEYALSPATVPQLDVKWTLTTGGDVSATPAVVSGAVYFPDWGGNLWKLDARSGAVLWRRRVADFVDVPEAEAVSRTSPAVVGDRVYFGTQRGAYLLALDTRTGELRWRTQLDSHPLAILTQSPVVYGGVVYQGISSDEESASADPNYECCTFRGSVVATDAATGRILWQTPMIPDQGSGTDVFSGAAVWGGTPAVDPLTSTLYVTTGNNYEVPRSVTDCQLAGGAPSECLPEWNHIDSFVALDLWTGRIKWATGQDRFDAWNVGCLPSFPPDNCPVAPGPDHDFGDGAHLFLLRGKHGHLRRAVGAGQKSGEYWMLDADTGAVLWSAAVGPGSALGGIQWGTATDGQRIYFASSNFDQIPHQLPNGQTISSSSFGALDPNTGRVIWQVAEPRGGLAIGALSTANGVVYAGAINHYMYALDGVSGAVLWEFLGQGSSNAGPAIVNGTVYWGNGYSRIVGDSGTTFYAFSLPWLR